MGKYAVILQVTSQYLKRPVIFLLLAAPSILSTAAFARLEQGNRSSMVLHYKEDTTAGAVQPDNAAKPAETDVYTRRESPGDEAEPALPRRVDGSENPDSSPKSGKPKYRKAYDQAAKKEAASEGGDESIGVSVGIGFGFNYFAGSLGLTFPINHYVAWGISGNYYSRDEKKIAELRTGGDLSLILRVPNFTPLTPFVSAGPGYIDWKRSKDDGAGLVVFDKAASPTAEWAVGASIRLARYVSLVAALRSTTYTASPPRVFEDEHTRREVRTRERFEFGFAFGF